MNPQIPLPELLRPLDKVHPALSGDIFYGWVPRLLPLLRAPRALSTVRLASSLSKLHGGGTWVTWPRDAQAPQQTETVAPFPAS